MERPDLRWPESSVRCVRVGLSPWAFLSLTQRAGNVHYRFLPKHPALPFRAIHGHRGVIVGMSGQLERAADCGGRSRATLADQLEQPAVL